MTAEKLQKELTSEIGSLFNGRLFEDTLGNRVPIKVYEQYLPIKQSEDDPDPIPYIIVRLENGTTQSGNDPQEVTVAILVGLFNDDLKNQGHKEVLSVIQRIHERFEKEPMLANQFMFQDPFDWALQDEETFPYYFGAISMKFKTAAIRKEDKYA